MKTRYSGLKSIFLTLVIIIAVALFIQTRSVNIKQHTETTDLLLHLKDKEAQLDQDVMKVISFQLAQYDPLVETRWQLNRLEEVILKRENSPFRATNPTIAHAITTYWGAIQKKLEIMERIKSRAAIVQNGLQYLPTAISKISDDNTRIKTDVIELLNHISLYTLFTSHSELESINRKLGSLTVEINFSQPQHELLFNILHHIRATLRHLNFLVDLKHQYLSIPSQQYFQKISAEYDSFYAESIKRAENFSLILLTLTLLSLLALTQVLRSLDAARKKAEQAWDRLHDAVESLSEAFALFDKQNRLVVHNRKWDLFYPWLKNHLMPGVSASTIEAENSKHIVNKIAVANQSGKTHPNETTYLQQLEGSRWLMASDNQTGDGGTVCVRTDITQSKQSEIELKKLSRALEQSPASVIITDTDGNIEYVNPMFEQMTGFTSAEAIGQNPRILKSGNKSPEEYKRLWDTIKSGKEWRGQFHNKRKDGSIFWESASISPMRGEDGLITHFIAVKEDITDRKRAEDQLRMNATVFETTSEGIMITDNDNHIKTVNPAFTHITGYQAEEVIGRTPSILNSGRHDKSFYQQMWKQLHERGSWSGEIWNRRKDGNVYPEWLSLVAIKDSKEKIKEYIAVFSDISRRKRDEEHIRHQAHFDALTGLPNRFLLFDRLDQAIISARREKWMFAMLFIDLDRFKSVNDTLGHPVGDDLLNAVADRLKTSIREADTVARFGGDEFVILLQDIKEPNAAAIVADKIIKALSLPFSLQDREIFIGASIGITLYPNDAEDTATLLRNADMAMYRAKEAGRNRYQFFTRAMQEQVKDQVEMEQDLRRALERGELALHYQPIVQADDTRPTKVEVLLRWRHPKKGYISPEQFIPLAEETGLIHSIGKWIIRTACFQVKSWHENGYPIEVSINLSGRQRELGFTHWDMAAILKETGISPRCLTLEITEGVLLENSNEVVSWLEAFRNLGISLSIDDFGTGYSSLSYLKRFPIDILKIDRAFIGDITENHDAASLVVAILAMADSLGLQVVAEGVETAAQAEFLISKKCKYLQGFYFSRALPADALIKWLNEKPNMMPSNNCSA